MLRRGAGAPPEGPADRRGDRQPVPAADRAAPDRRHPSAARAAAARRSTTTAPRCGWPARSATRTRKARSSRASPSRRSARSSPTRRGSCSGRPWTSSSGSACPRRSRPGSASRPSTWPSASASPSATRPELPGAGPGAPPGRADLRGKAGIKASAICAADDGGVLSGSYPGGLRGSQPRPSLGRFPLAPARPPRGRRRTARSPGAAAAAGTCACCRARHDARRGAPRGACHNGRRRARHDARYGGPRGARHNGRRRARRDARSGAAAAGLPGGAGRVHLQPGRGPEHAVGRPVAGGRRLASPWTACWSARSGSSRCSTTRTGPDRPTGGSGRSAARSRPTGTYWHTTGGAGVRRPGRLAQQRTLHRPAVLAQPAGARPPRGHRGRRTSPPSRSCTCARRRTTAGSGR